MIECLMTPYHFTCCSFFLVQSSALVFGGSMKGQKQRKMWLWRIDPTGQFYSADVAAIGRGSGLAERLIMMEIIDAMQGHAKNRDEWKSNESFRWHISNDDVTRYLESLSINEAVAIICKCLKDAAQLGEPDCSNDILWWDRLQGTIIKTDTTDPYTKQILYLNSQDIEQIARENVPSHVS